MRASSPIVEQSLSPHLTSVDDVLARLAAVVRILELAIPPDPALLGVARGEIDSALDARLELADPQLSDP